ncbi:hypothetical protein AC249_AIPGENE27578 [Exaiptasia diaphana]|nr:hypothetical protein AC249_AIPGENE27578 [Exaiptasia diaphana]
MILLQRTQFLRHVHAPLFQHLLLVHVWVHLPCSAGGALQRHRRDTEQTLDWKHKEEKYHRNEEKFISYYYEKCKAVCCKSPLDATIHVEHKNHVAQRIRQFALDKKAAYVVIGSRGLGRILRSLVSAVSDDVVHYSKIPVVVVPFHQE